MLQANQMFHVTPTDCAGVAPLPAERRAMFANCYAADMYYAVMVISMLLGILDDDHQAREVFEQWCHTFDELADHWSALVVGRL